MEKKNEVHFENIGVHPDGQILAMLSRRNLQVIDLNSNSIVKGTHLRARNNIRSL